MWPLRRWLVSVLFLTTTVVLFSLLPRLLDPTTPSRADRLRDKRWVKTSPYWVDRQACRWLSLCGIHHVRPDPAVVRSKRPHHKDDDLKFIELRRRTPAEEVADGASGGGPAPRPRPRPQPQPRSQPQPRPQPQPRRRPDAEDWEQAAPRSRQADEAAGTTGARAPLQEVPDYVLRYAPLVHLHSKEYFFPSDIRDHIEHMVPFVNGAPLNLSKPATLGDLHTLNTAPGFVYLTSEEDVEGRPEWLHSHRGVPTPFDGDDGRGDAEPGGGGRKRPDRSGDWHRTPGPRRHGTTWWEVDKDHPLHRISEPKTAPGGRRRGQGRQRRGLQQPQQQQQPVGGPAAAAPLYKPDGEGFSKAPSVLILVDKGSGILDAFWFFFYSYNLGQTVLQIRFGNHVGDWEHAMVRFENGIPRALFMSEHAGGQAFAWSALEKFQTRTADNETIERPVLYSAIGSHAMYAVPGNHPYVLPFGMLKDVTDRGPLWDPALNTYAYFYDYVADRDSGGTNLTSLTPAASNPEAPTSWFHFAGPWGDELYALRDMRQWRLFEQYHYITGPLGPKFKNLDRMNVCQTEHCTLLYSIEAGKKAVWYD